MQTIYLRREYTQNQIAGFNQKVVAYYRDKDMKEKLCVNPWESKPDKRNKYVMYNCNRYNAVWLEGEWG